ncbi:response regulator [Spongiibacter nanhainus]|uniref:Response regulator n=1 Tax=Spongiibacter nanhainus TaxID=2794344 RepID=A0A7T4R3A7_9GAMM|nr:response regulator [Spongiibacter nanhainus]QQD19690.1 response regulator [Spongiibacter nanhainus]
MKKINSILLIDDDAATNFLHRMVIEECGICDAITEAGDGLEALEYLTTATEVGYPQPDLIFLDINMPRMDGWEFLRSYGDLPDECKAGAVIAMLTTSLNPDDRERAKQFDCVHCFENKPLDEGKLQRLLAALE